MNREELLEKIHIGIDEIGSTPVNMGINDDEDLIDFALEFLLANIDDAMGPSCLS